MIKDLKLISLELLQQILALDQHNHVTRIGGKS